MLPWIPRISKFLEIPDEIDTLSADDVIQSFRVIFVGFFSENLGFDLPMHVKA